MKRDIQQVAVLGAGTMGARLAAHFANAGLRCFLLDRVEEAARTSTDPQQRNRLAQAGLEAALQANPPAFFTPEAARLITVGNFEDHLDWCSRADWIVEAIVEDLEAKQRLLAEVERVRRPGTVVTTNTSGLPVARIAEGRSAEFLRHWAGTHFFNPPRYLKLVEIIPGPATAPEVLDWLARICDERLGKGVVFAKDTPNFIANRIGTFAMVTALRLMQEFDLDVEDVDELTGPLLGRPRSATFRTADLVGLDVIARVVANLRQHLHDPAEQALFELPQFVARMLEQGWVGEKAGQGFYRRIQRDGESEILALDWRRMEYRPRRRRQWAGIEAARLIEDPGERLRRLLEPGLAGRATEAPLTFLWRLVGRTCLYAAQHLNEIANSIVDVDRAMRWGFGWELGPFETWDAVGVAALARALEREGESLPESVQKVLASPSGRWYEEANGTTKFFDPTTHAYQPVPEPPGLLVLRSLKQRGAVVERTAGASLVDLGDGVLCCEFHSKMNALGDDSFAMLEAGLKRLQSDFEALVIGNQGENFSAGANLMLLLLAAQEGEWEEIDRAVRRFQRINQAIKYAPRPVVAAPHGMTLGGGCELCLHTAHVHAAAETYMGLVEAGAGLIPAGGGTKEMVVRAAQAAGPSDLDLLQHLRTAFETIAMARVSTSADDARRLGYLRPSDTVGINRDRVLAQAKRLALGRVRAGYRPPVPEAVRVPGQEFLAAARLAIHLLQRGGYITDYDAVVAGKLAYVMAGGPLSAPQVVSEDYLLDLEREAFLSLCGEPRTQQRMAHLLKTGRPLRN